MQPASWEGDFIADVFTDRLRPTEELSLDDPIPTKCSFGRGKRQEEIPIPRMPKLLFSHLKKNVSSIGRGLQKKSNSSNIKKPGMIHSQSKPDQRTDPTIFEGKINPQNLAIAMEPLFIDQKCQLTIPAPCSAIDQPFHYENNVTGQVCLDVKNEEEFPSLTVVADKEPDSKQKKQNTKQKLQKKKNKKKSY